MGLEAGTHINDLVTTNPVGSTDVKGQGDNHLRLIKTVLKNSLPNATRAFYFPSSVAAKTTGYTIVAADQNKIIAVDATSAPFTVTFPAAAGIPDGFAVEIVKMDATANAVTLDGNGADLINGAATLVMNKQFQVVHLFWCNALSRWIALQNNAWPAVDSTLEYNGTPPATLRRAAITGAVAIAAAANAATQPIQVVVTIGDGVNVLTTGTKGFVPVSFAGTITGWKIAALQSGSCVLDVWKAAGAIPSNANTIAGSEKPTLSSAQLNSDLALSTWTTAIASGDVLGFEVESATTITQVTLTLEINRTG